VTRKQLSIYLMCGRATPELAEAAVAGGADFLELGFPDSDRGLPRVRTTRARAVAVPLVPMTYAALLEATAGSGSPPTPREPARRR
jgi:hypothetical protein